MKAILAADENFGIGKDGKLLCHISGDLKRFKEITMGKPVIMGRKTYESLPGKRPLPGRKNIVLSRTLGETDGFTVLNDINRIDEIIIDGDAFVIGGGEIYKLLLPRCTELFLTVIEKKFEVDTFFPNILRSGEWELTEKSESIEENGISYHFENYRRI